MKLIFGIEQQLADSSGRRNTNCVHSWQQLVKRLCAILLKKSAIAKVDEG
ncbi:MULTISPECIES: hypothetical protein [unclassified Aurantimonas]|nr:MULTISPECIES: hypothetical protein [unclassified Aurantimonas]MEC5293825.1 hypothetical protein [Aurantimonas sp. C2-3-R2]MEC5414882.1 hypothetical protein [Aurantimonas sp. C2-4-R8]